MRSILQHLIQYSMPRYLIILATYDLDATRFSEDYCQTFDERQ